MRKKRRKEREEESCPSYTQSPALRLNELREEGLTTPRLAGRGGARRAAGRLAARLAFPLTEPSTAIQEVRRSSRGGSVERGCGREAGQGLTFTERWKPAPAHCIAPGTCSLVSSSREESERIGPSSREDRPSASRQLDRGCRSLKKLHRTADLTCLLWRGRGRMVVVEGEQKREERVCTASSASSSLAQLQLACEHLARPS